MLKSDISFDFVITRVAAQIAVRSAHRDLSRPERPLADSTVMTSKRGRECCYLGRSGFSFSRDRLYRASFVKRPFSRAAQLSIRLLLP
ncbi:Uncharacterized protein APZ42_029065 [Daphnia magna]|uniref:Uncharacterized protein n=1 Tax=Daphnia magna TaxID=35525 RepID=A0A164PYC1_9CRUS|nr:Uncharacterized protein APZ42_029065 [Daphnia magna]